MSRNDQSAVTYEGEEADAGFAPPALDLIAAVALVGLALVMMAASWMLPMPGDIHTAPGLLPFLVAGSLLIMALGLGASALARRRAGVRAPAFGDRDRATDLRSLLLAGAVALYIAALQFMAFQYNVAIAGTALRLSAFEPATVLTLSTIIHLSWRGPLWITLVVSLSWTAILSLVFQLVFRIPLPGSF